MIFSTIVLGSQVLIFGGKFKSAYPREVGMSELTRWEEKSTKTNFILPIAVLLIFIVIVAILATLQPPPPEPPKADASASALEEGQTEEQIDWEDF